LLNVSGLVSGRMTFSSLWIIQKLSKFPKHFQPVLNPCMACFMAKLLKSSRFKGRKSHLMSSLWLKRRSCKQIAVDFYAQEKFLLFTCKSGTMNGFGAAVRKWENLQFVTKTLNFKELFIDCRFSISLKVFQATGFSVRIPRCSIYFISNVCKCKQKLWAESHKKTYKQIAMKCWWMAWCHLAVAPTV
jgi:hypothetical protein